MTTPNSGDNQRHPRRIWRPFVWFGKALKYLVQAGFIAWASLAIYYSNLPWDWLRLVLALVFAVFGIWTLWIARSRIFALVFVAGFAMVLIWWLTIKPTHDRDWQPEVAVMPRAYIKGDRVRITGYRNFDYRTRDDFTVRYQEREVSLAHLTGVDFFISYWMPGPVGHTLLSFNFDNAPPLNISIETRPVVGQGFSPIASLFKQFELIYVVGDERDLVRVRTNFRHERVFLYHIKISPERARQFFLIYLNRINELADHPEFYNLLSNSCTLNIVRYANAAGRVRTFDIRHFLNGWIAGYLYDAGWLNTDLSFEKLQQLSNIDKAAQAANQSPDFSKLIRKGIPPARP
ncbi:MAG: DUF4105 domain-containing protein [Proteobacteria bacterium]|nr:DUF4105 domain-containing protein [Pseudomonadota bacterium]